MEDCSSGDNRTVFAALPCLASGRSMVAAHGFFNGQLSKSECGCRFCSVRYRHGGPDAVCVSLLRPGREERSKAAGEKHALRFVLGAGLSALCTNVVVVSLFWLNACFTSADKTCDYRIIAAKVHDRRPKSRSSRYSASWLLNTFSYGELFVEGDRYTCVNVSPRMARQFEGSERVYLKIDLADGWLGWGVVKGIHPVATVYSQPQDEIRYSAGAQAGVAAGSSGQVKKKHTFLYTWQDIHIFAKLRGINLSDTAHVSVNRYVDASRDMPLWEIDVRDSVQPDKVKVILVHGETGEVVMDSYE